MDGLKRTRLIEPDTRRLAPQAVKRAVDYMRGNIAENIALADLASACDVSERTLLSQFHRFLGISPMAYLHRVRLNTARAELTEGRSDVAISDIAGRCGLSHLGRFATEYRRLFGETPSATRRRVRARADRVMANNRASSSAKHSPPALARREKPSLLLLPLRTETLRESGEARDLTERLAATLSRMSIATVILAHPSSAYPVPARQPRNAGTQYCLLGRLTQRDERIRVIVRLVDVAGDRHVWGDSFDGSANDPYQLQDRVVDGVLCGVVSHITDVEIERVHEKDPDDLGARDLTLQALPLILNADAASAQRAAAILDRAVDMDPADAVATALLAFSQLQLVGYYGTEAQGTAFNAAVCLSQRAVLLDNSDPLVLIARAGIAEWLPESDETDALSVRALAMDPTSTWVWERRAYARFSRHEDSDRAVADFHRALQLRGPGIGRSSCLHGIACAHLIADRWEEADLWLRRALAENPAADWMHRTMSRLALRRGDKPGLARSVECMRRARPFLTVSFLADNYRVCEPGWLDALADAGMPLT